MSERITATNSAGVAVPSATVALPVVLAPLSGWLHLLLVRRAEEPPLGFDHARIAARRPPTPMRSWP
jgi:hypothetical protein